MEIPAELPDETLLRAGGWNPRFTRVVARRVQGRVAIALVETKLRGHSPNEYLEVLYWSEEAGWQSVGGDEAGLCGYGWNSRPDVEQAGIAYAYGAAPGETEVIVEFGTERHRVPVVDEGWWLFAVESETSDIEPRRVS
ncbi:MAG: hypothetical protein ACT452_13615 [Microthrixaceae bacterium]